MNEQELRELALKLANQYGDDVGSYDFEFDDHGIVAVVRAAVAHGMRIGADLCVTAADEHDDLAEAYGMKVAAEAIRDKADELEAGK